MAHYSKEDIQIATSVNLKDYAKSMGFVLKKSDEKADKVEGYGGLFIFDKGFHHFSEDLKGNQIHFARNYLNMSFQQAVQSLLDFKGIAKSQSLPPLPSKDFGQVRTFEKSMPRDTAIPPPTQQSHTPPPPVQPLFQAPIHETEVRPHVPENSHNRFYERPPPDDYFGEPPPPDDYFGERPPPDDYFGEPPPPDDYFGEPPPPDDYFGEPPPPDDYWGEPPPPPDDFFGEPPPPDNFHGQQPPIQVNTPIIPEKNPKIEATTQNIEYELPPNYQHDNFTLNTPSAIKEAREERGELVLPPRSDDEQGTRTFQYLTKERCLDEGIVDDLMHKGQIFEAKTENKGMVFKNCAFLSVDKENTPKYCSIRSMGKTPFKQDLKNSDKSYGFTMKGTSSRVFVCESPIDVISHATLTKLNHVDHTADSRISLGGLLDKALERFLQENPHVKEIVFALDNDSLGRDTRGQPHNHGQEFAKKCCAKYQKLGFKVQIQKPKCKDFNLDLQEKMKPSVSKQLQNLKQQAPDKSIVPLQKENQR